MDVLMAAFAAAAFIFATAALGVALYAHHQSKAEIASRLTGSLNEILSARSDLAGTEARLEALLTRRLNEHSIDLRQQAHGDAMELIQNTLQQAEEIGRPNPLGMASFRSLTD